LSPRGALGAAGFASRTFLVALSACLLLLGCSSAPTREPDGDYAELKPLLYDYGLVFDCVAETIADEGFQVERADRETGVLETKAVPGQEDLVKRCQDGRRIRARVVRSGPKDFIVRLAASRLERDTTSTNVGEWRYLGRDEELLDRLKKRFDKEVEKRYKPRTDKG
jgi:hypothetical protein